MPVDVPFVDTAVRVAGLEPQAPLVVGRVEGDVHRADTLARRERAAVVHADLVPGEHVGAVDLDLTRSLEIDTVVVVDALEEVAFDPQRAVLHLRPAPSAVVVAVDGDVVAGVVIQVKPVADIHIPGDVCRNTTTELEIAVVDVHVSAEVRRTAADVRRVIK